MLLPRLAALAAEFRRACGLASPFGGFAPRALPTTARPSAQPQVVQHLRDLRQQSARSRLEDGAWGWGWGVGMGRCGVAERAARRPRASGGRPWRARVGVAAVWRARVVHGVLTR